MKLKIFWTDFSKRELRKIFNYHKDVANQRIAMKLVTGITQEVTCLQRQPKIGQREDTLIERKQKFRYIVYKS